MKYAFYLLVAVCIVLAIYSSKFNNPFKLIFIFGKKGSGKSTLMVKYMVKYLKRGWSVYTDMVGVNIKGVRFFNTDDLAKFVPEENSALFLDEVGLSPWITEILSHSLQVCEISLLCRENIKFVCM